MMPQYPAERNNAQLFHSFLLRAHRSASVVRKVVTTKQQLLNVFPAKTNVLDEDSNLNQS